MVARKLNHRRKSNDWVWQQTTTTFPSFETTSWSETTNRLFGKMILNVLIESIDSEDSKQHVDHAIVMKLVQK